jgi:hypothetical protein
MALTANIGTGLSDTRNGGIAFGLGLSVGAERVKRGRLVNLVCIFPFQCRNLRPPFRFGVQFPRGMGGEIGAHPALSVFGGSDQFHSDENAIPSGASAGLSPAAPVTH